MLGRCRRRPRALVKVLKTQAPGGGGPTKKVARCTLRARPKTPRQVKPQPFSACCASRTPRCDDQWVELERIPLQGFDYSRNPRGRRKVVRVRQGQRLVVRELLRAIRGLRGAEWGKIEPATKSAGVEPACAAVV